MKPVKAFTPYNLSSPAFFDWCIKAAKSKKTADVIKYFMAKDPLEFEWNTHGLIAPIDEGAPVHSLDGGIFLLCYQFNDRILPGAVRDEKLLERINAIQEKEDREVTKQEYAQTRDEVERELLPQAFIRRSLVPVFVYKERIFIGTTSAKKCETIIGHMTALMQARKIECELWNIWTEKHIPDVLRHVVFNDSDCFEGASAAVFKGADKRTIRIKDRGMHAEEVQGALANGAYKVTELQMNWTTEDGDSQGVFTLTEKLIFKGIKLTETPELKSAEDTHATYLIYGNQLAYLYKDAIDLLGGESDEPPEVQPEEDKDEL